MIDPSVPYRIWNWKGALIGLGDGYWNKTTYEIGVLTGIGVLINKNTFKGGVGGGGECFNS